MATRRRQKTMRPPFGERLATLRKQAGLTQEELGVRLGLSQRAIASWELRETTSLRPEQLERLAQVLDVTLEELVCEDPKALKKRRGPQGKLRRIFDEASQLPRGQQKDIIEVMDVLVRSKRKKAD